MKEEICATIDYRVESLSTTLWAAISAVQQETHCRLAGHQRWRQHHHKRSRTRSYWNFGPRNLSWEASRVKFVEEKCETLEGHSQINNQHIVRLPEGKEGQRPTNYANEILKELIGLDNAPLLDRAHRSLQPRPQINEQPRSSRSNATTTTTARKYCSLIFKNLLTHRGQ